MASAQAAILRLMSPVDDSFSGGLPVAAPLLDLVEDVRRLHRRLSISEFPSHVAVAGALETIQGEILDTLAELEVASKADAALSETHIKHGMRRFVLDLPAIVKIARISLESPLLGGRLLDAIFARMPPCEGDSARSRLCSTLHRAALRPFFMFLTRWLAFAELPDPPYAEEFFVVRSQAAMQPASAVASAPLTGSLFGLTSSSGKEASMSELRRLVAEREWFSGYEVVPGLVPTSVMSFTTAATILSIGNAVSVLRIASAWPAFETEGAAGVDAELGTQPQPSCSDGGHQGGIEHVATMLSRLLGAVREAPEFEAAAFEVLIDRIRNVVFGQLWLLLVGRGSFLEHAGAIRDFVLMGRGDLYRAFLELAVPVAAALPLSGLSSAALVSQLAAGPWQQAASLTGLRSDSTSYEYAREMEQRSSLCEMEQRMEQRSSLFSRCSLFARSRCLRWELPEVGDEAVSVLYGPSPASVEPRLCGLGRLGETGDCRLGRPSTVSAASVISSWFPVSTDSATDRSVERERSISVQPKTAAAATMVCVGAAGLTVWHEEVSPEVSAHDTLAVSPRSVLLVAAPTVVEPQSAGSGASTGAAWLSQPVNVSNGLLIRASLEVAFPCTRGVTSSPSRLAPASFSIVIQRDGLLRSGVAVAGAAAVPCGGHEGLLHSLVVHMLVKHLSSGESLAGSISPSADSPIGPARVGGTGRFRVVAAVYGPPVSSAVTAATADGRSLLASGALMEFVAPVSRIFRLDGGASSGAAATYALDVAVELAAAPDMDMSRSRVRVFVLDRMPGLSTAHSTGAAFSIAPSSTLQVLDAPIDTAACFDFHGSAWRDAGRQCAWVGITAPPAQLLPSDTIGSSLQPAVCVEVFDVVGACHGDSRDAGGASHASASNPHSAMSALSILYDVPWPLHLIFTSSTMALFRDLHSLLLRARRVSSHLQDAWRCLMSASSASAAVGTSILLQTSASAVDAADTSLASSAMGTGTVAAARRRASSATSSAGSGSSSSPPLRQPISGRGGKRSVDPRVRAQLRMRQAMQTLLRPVWLLRAHMSAVVDAVLFYWHSDVIASAFAELVTATEAAPNFLALVRAHDAYTHRLRAGAFLAQPSVSGCIDRLLETADAFASTVIRANTGASGADTGELLDLMHPLRGRPLVLAQGARFAADTQMLTGLLCGASEHLDCSSLLTRLNFNLRE